MRSKLKAEDRFWAKVDKNGPVPASRPDLGPCWLWTAGLFPNGYGQFKSGSREEGTRRSLLAHRYAYELLVGPIPADLQLDHLCREHPCVRPSHLEPVTNQENARRGLRVRATCLQGHAYDEANTYWRPQGWRECRACRAAAHKVTAPQRG